MGFSTDFSTTEHTEKNRSSVALRFISVCSVVKKEGCARVERNRYC